MSGSNILNSKPISREELYEVLAFSLARRSSCKRAQVGAVVTGEILGSRAVILGTGYNGAPAGMPHCIEAGCNTDDRGRCKATIHAEVNALTMALRNPEFYGASAILWVTHEPCYECMKLIITTGIDEVKTWIPYEDPDHQYLPSGLIHCEFLPRTQG